MSFPCVAITGGTGFVGRAFIAEALKAGWTVRALARKPQKAQNGVTWVAGALDNQESLNALMTGAEAVVHIAGAVNAPNRAGFAQANIAGTEAVLAAATQAGVRRFIHISSLSAREPTLSNYGWSKAEGEQRVMASTLAWTVIRPPGIYGPGDTEMRDLYRFARHGLVVVPPNGAISLLHVDDLARLLMTLLTDTSSYPQCYEPDDGRDDWTHQSYAQAIGAAYAQKVAVLHLPRLLLYGASGIDRLLRGAQAKLTLDRVNYLTHHDWRVDADKRPPQSLWQPQIETREGIRLTARSYDKGEPNDGF